MLAAKVSAVISAFPKCQRSRFPFPQGRTAGVEQFSFPKFLCAPPAERRHAVPGSCSAFRLLSCFRCLVQLGLCCDANKNLLVLGFCGITENAMRRKHFSAAETLHWGFPSIYFLVVPFPSVPCSVYVYGPLLEAM